MNTPGMIETLRARRGDCSLSHAEAAHLSGLSASTIKAMEGPRGHLTDKTLTALCRGYALAQRETQQAPTLEPVLGGNVVRAIATTIIPLVEVGNPDGIRALADYHVIVVALASGADVPDAARASILHAAREALRPMDAELVMLALDGPKTDQASKRRSYEPGEVNRNIAANLRRLRKARGWSIARLGKECDAYGASQLTQASLENIERGQDPNAKRKAREVTAEELFVLAGIFGVTTDALAGHGPCVTCADDPLPGFTCNACGRSASTPPCSTLP